MEKQEEDLKTIDELLDDLIVIRYKINAIKEGSCLEMAESYTNLLRKQQEIVMCINMSLGLYQFSEN